MKTCTALLGALILCGACASGGDDPQTSQDAAPRADAPGASDGGAGEALIGAFLIELKPPAGGSAGSTLFSGKVSDGPTPDNVVLDLTKESGGCRLLTPRAPFCDPPCAGVCVEDNRCGVYPTAQNLGPVEVRGLGSAALSLEYIVNGYQLVGDPTLPFPPAPEGSEVKVIVKGGAFGPFTLTSQAVAPLAWSDTLTLERNKAIALTWTAPGMRDVGRIEVKVDISHHGGKKGEIDCDFSDTGSGQIPAELVTKLIDLGVAGFPTVTLTRVATGSATVSRGVVRLQLLSSIAREVTVAGYTSCDESNPCPGGKVCQDNKTCK